MAKQVEGIIYVTAHERVMHCIPDDLPIPAVMAYGYTESKKVPSIVVDDEHGAYEVVCHLIRHGHRRIGVVMGKRIVFMHRHVLSDTRKHCETTGLCMIRNLLHRETGQEKVDIEWQMNCLHMM